MNDSSKPAPVSFPCQHCHEPIFLPAGTPPTEGPCPHCGEKVMSPDLSEASEASPEELAENVSAQTPEQPTAKDNEPGHGRDIKDVAAPRVLAGAENQRRAHGSKLILVSAILILLVAGAVAFWLAREWKNKQNTTAASGASMQSTETAVTSDEVWRTSGWKQDASEVLSGFMTAKSPDERMKYVIPNEGVLEEIKMYYPEGNDDSDTPMESFGHVTGNESDHARGIFLMQYRQPANIDMRDYFSPIGSLDKILGVKGSTLIEMAHQINEGNLSKPIGINAFFKKTDDGLKLDASVFIQGKFRTFRSFVDYAQPGKTKVFRLVVSESLSHELRHDRRYRTYRLEDFSYKEDFVIVPVAVDSEVGKILSVLNWREMNRDLIWRTATVELGWSNERPSRLGIKQVKCWEFLGVGGTVGNTRLKAPTPKAPVAKAPVKAAKPAAPAKAPAPAAPAKPVAPAGGGSPDEGAPVGDGE